MANSANTILLLCTAIEVLQMLYFYRKNTKLQEKNTLGKHTAKLTMKKEMGFSHSYK